MWWPIQANISAHHNRVNSKYNKTRTQEKIQYSVNSFPAQSDDPFNIYADRQGIHQCIVTRFDMEVKFDPFVHISNYRVRQKTERSVMEFYCNFKFISLQSDTMLHSLYEVKHTYFSPETKGRDISWGCGPLAVFLISILEEWSKQPKL